MPTDVPSRVLDEFDIHPASLKRLRDGHINATWTVERRDGAPGVLQAVNPVFPPDIHLNIDAVTRHLANQGLLTPQLLSTTAGHLWLEVDDCVWRLQTRIAGTSYEALETATQAHEAGRILGQFHAAVADLDHDFVGTRLDVHNTSKHLADLQHMLAAHRSHDAYDSVRLIATDIFELASSIDDLPSCPDRIVHGDPKISNILFDPVDGTALCLVDLDTLARMPIALELGDAFRSWCNEAAEDSPNSCFSVTRFASAISGYSEGCHDLLEPAEIQSIPSAIFRIAIELAARFAADALAESYFGWDSERFASASAHNQARAHAQLELAHSVVGAQKAIRSHIAEAFPPH